MTYKHSSIQKSFQNKERKKKRMQKLLLFTAAFAVFMLFVDATRIADRCNPNLADFKKNNRGQLDAIAPHPASDLWYQNISITTWDPATGDITPVVNYGYWQSREYSARDCAFVEVQAWYRSENQLAFQQINSNVNELLRLAPTNGNNSNRNALADQTYTVEWKTNLTADSAAVEGSTIRSFASGSGIVRIDFYPPQSNTVFFTEELRTVKPFLRRFYTQTMTVDPTGSTLPLVIEFDSFVVPRAYQPGLVQNAFDAYGRKQVPVEQDPQDPSRYIYLYTSDIEGRDVSSNNRFTLPDEMTIDEFLVSQVQQEEE